MPCHIILLPVLYNFLKIRPTFFTLLVHSLKTLGSILNVGFFWLYLFSFTVRTEKRKYTKPAA